MLAITDLEPSNEGYLYIWILPDLDHAIHSIPLPHTIKAYMAPHWSPTGDRILFTAIDRQGKYQLYQIYSLTFAITLLGMPCSYCYGLGWFADGEHVAFFAMDSDDWTINRLNCKTGAIDCISSVRHIAYAWSPDWKHLIRASLQTNELIITNEMGLGLEQTIPMHDHVVRIDWSPNNQYLACTISTETGRSLKILTLNGTEMYVIATIEYESPIVWSPSTTYIAYLTLQENKAFVTILNITTGDQQLICPLNPGDASGEILPTPPVWMTPHDSLLISSFVDDRYRLLVYAPITNTLNERTPLDAPFYMDEMDWHPKTL